MRENLIEGRAISWHNFLRCESKGKREKKKEESRRRTKEEKEKETLYANNISYNILFSPFFLAIP